MLLIVLVFEIIIKLLKNPCRLNAGELFTLSIC